MTATKIFKCYKNSTLSDAHDAGTRISELLDFNFFWGGGGGHADPPMGKGPYSPFSGHSHLLHFQWSLITKVIETPVHVTLFCMKQ